MSKEEEDMKKLEQFVDCRWCPIYYLCDAHLPSDVIANYIRIAGWEVFSPGDYGPDNYTAKTKEEYLAKLEATTEKCPLKALLEKK